MVALASICIQTLDIKNLSVLVTYCHEIYLPFSTVVCAFMLHHMDHIVLYIFLYMSVFSLC